MKNGKAKEPNLIPVEEWKAFGDEGMDILYDLMIKILEQEKVPEEWQDSILITFFKGKGDVQECDLEKAFDRFPREEVLRCLSKKMVPEKYVQLIQEKYQEAYTRVRSIVGVMEGLEMRVGLHHESVLRPFIFKVVIDVMTEAAREALP
ncbi:uncharacterized protein [Palaemon carinicauda]|uniref:uncharacterized protein n=1 Tax=Palaemon carinicauda TaxID=392227 RepID=UPI0035B64734